ncbi:hypothetical protein Tco_1483864, partial [Tanacetum coccineum]
MEITSINPLFNQEDYSYFHSVFQELDGHDQSEISSLAKRRKVDEQEILGLLMDDDKNGDDGRVRKAVENGGVHRRLWVKERSKGWWKYHDSDECSDVEFRRAFRMSKGTFNMICEELDSGVAKKDTMLRMAIPVRQRVAVCIYRLATGDPLRTVSSLFGLGISTCHKLVLEVCAAIKAVLMPKFLRWPDSSYVNEAASSIGCSVMKAPFKYLGVTVGGNTSLVKSWDETINKLKL